MHFTFSFYWCIKLFLFRFQYLFVTGSGGAHLFMVFVLLCFHYILHKLNKIKIDWLHIMALIWNRTSWWNFCEFACKKETTQDLFVINLHTSQRSAVITKCYTIHVCENSQCNSCITCSSLPKLVYGHDIRLKIHTSCCPCRCMEYL